MLNKFLTIATGSIGPGFAACSFLMIVAISPPPPDGVPPEPPLPPPPLGFAGVTVDPPSPFAPPPLELFIALLIASAAACWAEVYAPLLTRLPYIS